MSDHDTIAAIATAPGRAGIGVVRISGPSLGNFVRDVCARSLPARTAVLCDFHDTDGSVIDRGIALYFPAPKSYTGEDVLELHGHGGPVVLQLLLRRCLALGARMALPGEFSKRAFLAGKMDLAQAEAVADLIDAATEQAARCANRSMGGALSRAVQQIAGLVLELRALTEASLDFPEEELDSGAHAALAGRLAVVQALLDDVLKAAKQGSLLREGVLVVLVGRPNVGKSTLLNRLAGEDVAIVTALPGTTRDAIRQSISLRGVPLHLIDTAGIRETQDETERMGIARTWAAIAQADLALLIVDATEGASLEDLAILAKLPRGLPCLRILNKCDLAAMQPGRSNASEETTLVLSAKTGAGMDELETAVAKAIGLHDGTEGVLMARARHMEALRMAESALKRAREQVYRQELFAEELRKAHQALMGITGEVTSDDLLGEIFSRFCIGK